MKTGTGVGIPTILTLIFLVLKLTDNIDWSWWWIFSPLWISVGLFLVVGTIVILVFNKYFK